MNYADSSMATSVDSLKESKRGVIRDSAGTAVQQECKTLRKFAR